MPASVVNIKTGAEYDVYIGRPRWLGDDAPWGNPFSHLDNSTAKFHVATREQAVERHKEWILTQSDLVLRLPELRGKRLGCYCAPLACHGDNLIELANELPWTLIHRALSLKLAKAMVEKTKEPHVSAKGWWGDWPLVNFIRKFQEESAEFMSEMYADSFDPKTAWKEAADIANVMVMMLDIMSRKGLPKPIGRSSLIIGKDNQ